jgi:NADPH-dependent 2,4-dienoyl-CoA reductase/sulfur reductase-like enzyme
MGMNIVIVGNGPAAVAAAEAARLLDGQCRITLISKESVPFYSPCPLAEYVEDSVPREHLFLRDEQFYRDQGFNTLFGRAVTAIDTTARQVLIGSGADTSAISYDRLLIASGAQAVMPPIPGLATTPGVFALKTLDDADRVVARLTQARRAVVIGSGFIGLEAAQALQRRGLAVTVVEAQGQVLPQMLDAEMAALVEQRLCEHGIDVRLNSPAQAVLGGAAGVTAVLAGGQEIPCDLVICAAGVRPDLSLLSGSGIAAATGILVNEYMETSAPDVYAAGDVVEGLDHQGQRRVLPIWPNAVNGGRIAGANMVAARSRRFRGHEAVNVVRIFDLPVASFGNNQSERSLRYAHNGIVKKLNLSAGKVVGAQFFGDVNATGIYLELMNKGTDVDHLAKDLLGPGFGYASLLPRPPLAVRRAA